MLRTLDPRLKRPWLTLLAVAVGWWPSWRAHAADDPSVLVDGLALERWTAADGLPLDQVADLALDDAGYLWLTTFDGLVRFDGRSFQAWRRASHPTLPSNRFLDVEVVDGTVWANTETGDLVAVRDGVVEVWPAAEGQAGPVGALQQAGGETWALARRGLLRLTASAPVLEVASEPAPMALLDIEAGDDGRLWVATGRPAVLTRGPAGRWEERPLDPADGAAMQVWPGEREAAWVATERALVRLGDRGAQRWPFEPSTLFTCKLVGWRGQTMVQHAGGWWRVQDDRLETLPSGQGPWDARRCGAAVLHQGHLWRSDADLLFRDESPVLRIPRGVRSVLPTGDGGAWLATELGLVRLRPALVQPAPWTPGVPPPSITNLAVEADGSVLATTSRELWRLPATGLAPQRIQEPTGSIGGLFITDGQGAITVTDAGPCMVVDGGCVPVPLDLPAPALVGPSTLWRAGPGEAWWLGSETRLYRQVAAGPDAGWEEVLTPAGESVRDARTFGATRRGAILVGTAAQGLLQWRDGRVRQWTRDSGLRSDAVRAIWIDEQERAWLGTQDGGLCRMEPDGAPRCVGTADGLPEDVVNTVIPDGRGRIWMSGFRGIWWVHAAQLDAALDSEPTGEVLAVRLDARHGMPDPETNGRRQHPAAKASDGRLWFATQQGVVAVDPGRVPIPEPPRVELLTWAADGAELPTTPHTLTLDAGTRDLSVRWTAPALDWPDALRYRWRLVGYDDRWSAPSQQIGAAWTNLPPGPLAVEVQASFDGRWGPTLSLPLQRQAAFRETAWFPLSLGGGILLLSGVAAWVRVLGLRRRQAELEAEVAARTARIATQAERIKEQDALRTRMVTDLSHELRTPLALVTGPLEDLAQEATTLSAQGQQSLVMARRNAGRMHDLVDQLFNLARLDSGGLPVRMKAEDLRALLLRVSSRFEAAALRAGLSFQVQVEAPLVVYLDRDLVDKVLANLLSNAIKYTPAGGSVTLRMSEDDVAEVARVEVIDTGPGILAEHRARIFDRFYQVSQGVSRRYGGAGVGLNLARELVTLHGGELDVISEPGRGSTFWFTLPLGVDHVALQDVDLEPAVDGHQAFPLGDGDAARQVTPRVEPPEDAPTVLLVEDHPDMRLFLAAHLRHHFQVVEAADGHAALQAVAAARPDAIVSDVMMPGMDGLTLCRRLRAQAETADLPVVLVSAKAAEADRLEGLELADDYLTKPVFPHELVARVRRLLRPRAPEPPAPQVRALDPDAPGADDLPLVDQELLARIEALVEERLADDQLSVSTMAKELAMSRRQLHRTVQRLTGDPPSVFLKARRMAAARRMLLEGRFATVAEVAAAVGMTPSYFSRVYRADHGHPPIDDLKQ